METAPLEKRPYEEAGLAKRIAATFRRPRVLASWLHAKPRVLGVIILFLVVWNVLAALTFEHTLDLFVDQVYELPNMPSDQQEKIATWLEDHHAVVQVVHHVGLTFSWVAALLVWAGLLYLSAGMFFETPAEPVQFRHVFALAAHANLVNLPHALITTIWTLIKGEYVRSLSLGTLVGLKATTAAGVAAEWLTPFNLWWIGLLGVGCAVFYRQSLRRAIIVPLGVSIVFRIIQVAMSAFSAAGQR